MNLYPCDAVPPPAGSFPLGTVILGVWESQNCNENRHPYRIFMTILPPVTKMMFAGNPSAQNLIEKKAIEYHNTMVQQQRIEDLSLIPELIDQELRQRLLYIERLKTAK